MRFQPTTAPRSGPAGKPGIVAALGSPEPSLPEVLGVLAASFAVHLAMICRVRSFWDARASFCDGEKYLDIAEIIRLGALGNHARP